MFALESDPLSRTVFAFADVVLHRSVIDLGQCVILEGIRLTTDLRLVFRKALIAFVDTFNGFFFRFCFTDFFINGIIDFFFIFFVSRIVDFFFIRRIVRRFVFRFGKVKKRNLTLFNGFALII